MTNTPSIPKGSDEFSKRIQSMLGGKGSASAHLPPGPVKPASSPPAPPRSPETRPDAQPVGIGEHVVRAGECVSSIARDHGLFWQTIWDDAQNAIVKQTRIQPNVLMPGDRLHVPPVRRKEEPGATELRHRFVRRGEPSHLKIRVLDQDEPRANEPFKLVIDGQQEITGFTDPEGRLDVPIPGNAKKGELTVGVEPDLYKATLNLGGLDPVATWAGVKARLKNLGFECPQTGERDDATIDALNEFRDSEGLPKSDDIDEATRDALARKHGS